MREKRYRPYTSKYVLLFLAAASFITLVLGVYNIADYSSFKNKAAETEAVITDAYVYHSYRRSGRRRRSRYECTAYLEYTVNGETYNCTIRDFDSSSLYMSESDYIGRSVTLLYDPDNPSDARPANRKGAGVPLTVAGIALAAMCAFFYGQNNYYEKMIKNGAVLDAVVTDIEHKTVVHRYRTGRGLSLRAAVNSYTDEEHYSIIVCEWENPLTGQKYIFRSQRVKEFVEPYVGQTVRVYADPQNYNKYFVDVDDLLAKPFMSGRNKAFTYKNRP